MSSKQKPNEPCQCGSGKKFKKCCQLTSTAPRSLLKSAGRAPTIDVNNPEAAFQTVKDDPEAARATASTILAQKATFIANQLGLDPSLPLSELMAAASKRMGVATHVSNAELKQADGLIAQARSAAPTSDEPDRRIPRPAPCSSCGDMAARRCAVNGCCSKCLFEVSHFERLGHNAMCDSDQARLAEAGGARAFSYGEVTTLGFRQLATRMALTPADSFVDCGSGTGRLVMQAHKEFGVKSSIGVELSSSRHRIALDLLAASESATKSSRSRTSKRRGGAAGGLDTNHVVQFLCADFAVRGLWTSADGGGAPEGAALAGATVVFTCSVLFDDGLMRRLVSSLPYAPSILRVHPPSPLRSSSSLVPLLLSLAAGRMHRGVPHCAPRRFL